MIISQTTKMETEPDENQAYMPYFSISALKQERLSKGLVAYEAIMLANEMYEDPLQRIRSQLVDELEGQVSGLSVRNEFKKIIHAMEEDAREELIISCEYEADEAIAKHPTTLYLPLMLTDQFDFQRGLGKLLTDSLVFVEACPWGSRVEFVQDLIDLLSLARGGSVEELEEPSQFVIDVATGRSNTYYSESLQPLHEAIMGDSPFQPIDRDGKRTDVDESVDGVPAWASAYSWDAVSPADELELEEAKELAVSTAQTKRERVPIVYARMNWTGGETGAVVGESQAVSQTNVLYKFNEDVSVKAESTLETYIEETLELMQSSPAWVESPVRKAFREGIELPKSFVVGESVENGEGGREFVVTGIVDRFNVFEYVPDGDGSLWEEHRAEVVELIEVAAGKRDSIEVPPIESGLGHKRKAAQDKIAAYDTQIEQAENLLAWIDEQAE
jgi:hypothetical protein